MYQDYCGNYDTSSRGSSSTSPAQPESFTSGSSTIGSPISTSGYQVPAPTPTPTPLLVQGVLAVCTGEVGTIRDEPDDTSSTRLQSARTFSFSFLPAAP